MGFLDSVGGFLSGIANTAIDAVGAAGGFVVNNAQSLASIAALVNQVRNQQAATNGSAMSFNATAALQELLAGGGAGAMTMPGMTVNPDTGSLVQQFVGALGSVLGNLGRGTAGAVLGGAAGGAAVDAGSALLSQLFGGGGVGIMGPVPRDPQTGRRLSAITFVDERTGKPVVYKSQGSVILSSSDLAGARKTQRVARRAAKGRRRLPRLQAGVVGPGRTHVVCGGCLTSPCGCKG
jgi:hypothetical protein